MSTVTCTAFIAVAGPASAAAPAVDPAEVHTTGQKPAAPPYAPVDEAVLAKAHANAAAGKFADKPVEDVSKRSRYSSTVLDPQTGKYQTKVGAGPVNYKDAAGKWQPIDTKLTAADDALGAGKAGWRSGANDVSTAIPETLGDPVKIASSDGKQWVSVQLDPAASGVPNAAAVEPVKGKATSATEIAFADVLPGVDVAYESTSTGVKDTTVLNSLEAAKSLPAGGLTFTVATSDDLSLAPDKETPNTISVVGAKGAEVFEIPAPWMKDAKSVYSTDIPVTLTKGAKAGTWTLALTPDAKWLSDPDRAWPVTIDPTVGTPTTTVGCSIANLATSLCANTEYLAYWQTAGPDSQRRVPLRFDDMLSVIPADAMIATAQLNLYLQPDAGQPSTATVNVRGLTNSFTTAATWTNRAASTPWTTAGGDRTATLYAQKTVNTNNQWNAIDVSQLTQAWTDGSLQHFGFMIEKPAATTAGDYVRIAGAGTTNNPYLYVVWEPRTGQRKGNSAIINENLTDRTTISVNPATGNASVTTQDLKISGVGLDLNVAHTSQSLDTGGIGTLGYGWTSSLEGNRIRPFNGGTVANTNSMSYTDGAGAQWTFYKAATGGTWIRPMGLDADLTYNSGTDKFTLKERKSRVTRVFRNVGTSTVPKYAPETIKDRDGNTISFTYDTTARLPYGDQSLILRKVTDTRGRDLTLDTPYFTGSVTDVANRTPIYTVTSNKLESVTDADGGFIDYEYDTANRVSAVITPNGKRTELTYDTSGKITQLKRVDTGAGNPTWGFAYGSYTRDSAGKPSRIVTVTDPLGHDTKYTADGRGLVTKVEDARNKSRSTTYSPNDDVATSTGATGSGSGSTAETSTSTYDTTGDTYRLNTDTIPTGAGTSYTYDTTGYQYDVKKSTDERSQYTENEYTTTGHPKTITKGVTGTTTAVKNLYQGETDPDYGGTVNCLEGGGATKAGLLCETRDELYVATSTVANRTKHRTAYRYNALGELVRIISPATNSSTPLIGDQTFTYDSLSRKQTGTDGRGNSTYYGYDEMDRTVYVQYANGNNDAYWYGGTGNDGFVLARDERTTVGGSVVRQTAYGRDGLGRLTAVTSPEDTTFMGYDKASNLTSYTDNGGTVAYGYNVADQLTSLTLPGGNCTGLTPSAPGTTSSGCVQFLVDDDGRRTATLYPGNSTRQDVVLDKSGRPKQIVGKLNGGSTQKINLNYTYTTTVSGVSKDTKLVYSAAESVSGNTTSYAYDNWDRMRVSSYANSGGTAILGERFCYDNAGNFTKYYRNMTSAPDCTTASPTATYTYNDANQMITGTGAGPTGVALAGSSFTYDLDGNQTGAKSQIGRTATYGDREQTASFTPAGGSAIGQTYSGGGNTERILAGSTSFKSSPLSPAPAWSKTGTTSTWTVRDPKGVLIAIRRGVSASDPAMATYFPFTDRQGNVRAMSTANATSTSAEYQYSGYGALTGTTGSLSQPYRYGNGFTDDATGLVKLGARYYDAVVGRFTQPDPTRQETHPYLYSRGCPSSYSDPEGTDSGNDGLDALGILQGCAEGAALAAAGGAELILLASASGFGGAAAAAILLTYGCFSGATLEGVIGDTEIGQIFFPG